MAETIDATQRKECDIYHQENEAKAEEKLGTYHDSLKMNDSEKTVSENLETEGPKLSYHNEATISQKLETDDAPKVDETDEQPITDAQPLSPAQEKHVDKRRAPVPQEQSLEQRAPAQAVREHPSLYGLPDGWIIEKRPRPSPKYLGKSDKYFYEPGTLKLFRSLVGVQRHLRATGQPTRSGQVINEHTPGASHQHGDQSLALQGSQMHSEKPGRKRKDAPYFGFVFDKPPKTARWALRQNDHQRAPQAGHK